MDNVEEEEEAENNEKAIKVSPSKDKGLADVEVGSACYMSEMLNFNLDDYDDCENAREDDLLLLNDPFVKTEIKVCGRSDGIGVFDLST